jgi:hypothetical protein
MPEKIFSIGLPDEAKLKGFGGLREKMFNMIVGFLRVFWEKGISSEIIEHVKIIPYFCQTPEFKFHFSFRIVVNTHVAGKIEISGLWDVEKKEVKIEQITYKDAKTPEQAADILMDEILSRINDQIHKKEDEILVLRDCKQILGGSCFF